MSSFHDQSNILTVPPETSLGVEPQANLDPRALRVCCGTSITPRLAEIRQSGEQTLFVTVWQCPKCKRVTY
jgi:hypothetical protein